MAHHRETSNAMICVIMLVFTEQQWLVSGFVQPTYLHLATSEV